jgi:hypothetical protein
VADGFEAAPLPSSKGLEWNQLVSTDALRKATDAQRTWQQSPCVGLADLASRYFSCAEFEALNSGHYHNSEHPLRVGEAVGGLAHGMGWSPERKLFMQQVALLHDADDRSQMGSSEVRVGTPARVQVTLEWMEQQKDTLCQRMGWNPEQHLEAKALIARSDFPFDDKPRQSMGTAFDGQSPLQVYRHLLEQLPEQRRSAVMQDALALRFADQVGCYSADFDTAVNSVQGLAKEIHLPLSGALKNTPSFLSQVGQDTEFDQGLAQELKVAADLPGQSQLMAAFEPQQRKNLTDNIRLFEWLGQALEVVPADQVESQLPSLQATALSCQRFALGR